MGRLGVVALVKCHGERGQGAGPLVEDVRGLDGSVMGTGHMSLSFCLESSALANTVIRGEILGPDEVAGILRKPSSRIWGPALPRCCPSGWPSGSF